jgi:hypothetical protein
MSINKGNGMRLAGVVLACIGLRQTKICQSQACWRAQTENPPNFECLQSCQAVFLFLSAYPLESDAVFQPVFNLAVTWC